VPSRRGFQRLELALGLLGLTAGLLVLVLAVHAISVHGAEILRSPGHIGDHASDVESIVLLLVGAVDGFVIMRAARSLVRQLRRQRAFLCALPVRRTAELHGHAVRLFPGGPLDVFCAGLLRPAIYLSEETARTTAGGELRAILAHEAHHRARRDPLRLLLARTVSDAFRPLPPLASLADRHRALADLSADAAAVRALGSAQPLAAALVRFDATADRAGGGVAPERVDQLVRDTPPETVPSWLLAAAGVMLAGITAAAVSLALGWHPGSLPLAIELIAIVVAFLPASLAAERTAAYLSAAA
jgi:hypothetical protein